MDQVRVDEEAHHELIEKSEAYLDSRKQGLDGHLF